MYDKQVEPAENRVPPLSPLVVVYGVNLDTKGGGSQIVKIATCPFSHWFRDRTESCLVVKCPGDDVNCKVLAKKECAVKTYEAEGDCYKTSPSLTYFPRCLHSEMSKECWRDWKRFDMVANYRAVAVTVSEYILCSM